MKKGLFLFLVIVPLVYGGQVKRVLVKSSEKKIELLKSEGSIVKHLFNNYYVIQTNDIKKIKSLNLKVLNSSQSHLKSNIEKLEKPEFIESSSLTNSTFNDPRFSRQYSFKNVEKNGMNVFKSYESRRSPSREKIIVAVVDTGVDANHEDLKPVMWVNSGEIPGNNIDDDQNGYIDDIHGINTLNRSPDGKATGDITDRHGHGTHVSGTIAAKQNNQKGVAGIASNVEIMAIRTVPNRGDELDIDVVESFIYAAKHGAKIINCSFGKGHNEGGMIVKEAIDHIYKEYGTIVVAAAGNSSKNIDRVPAYPASFESETLFVVASTSPYGNMSYFSNYGIKSVDLAAPGERVHATYPGNRYANMSGTSMASPNVAGALAEFWSRYPELTGLDIIQKFIDSVYKVPGFKRKLLSGGRIDLFSTLQSL